MGGTSNRREGNGSLLVSETEGREGWRQERKGVEGNSLIVTQGEQNKHNDVLKCDDTFPQGTVFANIVTSCNT